MPSASELAMTRNDMISAIIPVYRNASGALDVVGVLLQQTLPQDASLEIIIVDDGSSDGTAGLLREHANENVRVLENPYNMGRSIACGTGANQARGGCLIFIDSDCIPESQSFLAAHLQVLRGGHIASIGPVVPPGSEVTFWSRYQGDASRRRERQHSRGAVYSGTTANFGVLTSAFRRSGGFDPRYVGYGFEDRDLLVRLSRLGSLEWCPEARVTHLDVLTLSGVLEKMRIAGGSSAALFSRDHPEAYRTLGFAALDVRLHPMLRPVAKLTRPLLRAAPAVERLLCRRWIPYRMTRPVVKLFAALAYMQGTAPTRRLNPASRDT
jgi:GT2 family glycosyltransferase